MMITKCSECSIRLFMTCLFGKNTEGLNGGDFDKIFTEYIDLSGIGETKEYDLLWSIHNIQSRVTFIAAMIDLQKKFFKEFDMPFVNAFDDFRSYGHRLKWNQEKPEEFLNQLRMIEVREKKFQAELDAKVVELQKLKKEGVTADSNGRADFVRQLNSLGKAGFRIDKDKTDMEELALMIRDQNQIVKDQIKAG